MFFYKNSLYTRILVEAMNKKNTIEQTLFIKHLIFYSNTIYLF